MLRDPQHHRIEGFGQWEFLSLLGVTLGGEAREVHNSFLDEWSFEDRHNPNYWRARRAERTRDLWRTHRCDRAAFKTIRLQSGFDSEPLPPTMREPDDLENFIADLQERFRSSTTEDLSSFHGFRPYANEGLEHMFARFNLVAKPLEEERPPVITLDQIKKHYLHHLETILAADDYLELERQIWGAERDRATQGRRPLSRLHIHLMALQDERDNVVEQMILRALGLLPPAKLPTKDRFGIPANYPRKRKAERERRTCNQCGIHGHIRMNCPDLPPKEGGE